MLLETGDGINLRGWWFFGSGNLHLRSMMRANMFVQD